jgi:hypothetical protein
MNARSAPDPARRPVRRGPRSGGAVVVALLAVACAALPGCSRKLSAGGSAMDVLLYDVCGMDRGTSYYFDKVRTAHDRQTFGYRYDDDTYLVDKCVDAVNRLGTAEYPRIEGQAQVVLLLSDVLVEDPSSLAKASAAVSLTQLALRTPAEPGPAVPDRGDRALAVMKELDGLHDEQGRRRDDSPATRARVGSLADELGRLEFRAGDVLTAKNALKFFPTRAFVVRETDPELRRTYDRAIVRRMQVVVRETLNRALFDPNHNVRADAVRGLKTLRHAGALDDALERLEIENHQRVRAEIVEYLGAVGGPKAAERLVSLVEDSDGTVRYKARQALARIAGQDLGNEREPWEAWARTRFPGFGAADAPAATPAGAPGTAEPVGSLR